MDENLTEEINPKKSYWDTSSHKFKYTATAACGAFPNPRECQEVLQLLGMSANHQRTERINRSHR